MLRSSMQQWGATTIAILLFACGVVAEDDIRACMFSGFKDERLNHAYCYTMEPVHRTSAWSEERLLAVQMCQHKVRMEGATKPVRVAPLSINSDEEKRFIISKFDKNILDLNEAQRATAGTVPAWAVSTAYVYVRVLETRTLRYITSKAYSSILVPFRPATTKFYDDSSNDYILKVFKDLKRRDARHDDAIFLDIAKKDFSTGSPRPIVNADSSIIIICKARLDFNPPTTKKPVKPTTTARAMVEVATMNATTASGAIQQSPPSVQLLTFTCGLAAVVLPSLCIYWT